MSRLTRIFGRERVMGLSCDGELAWTDNVLWHISGESKQILLERVTSVAFSPCNSWLACHISLPGGNTDDFRLHVYFISVLKCGKTEPVFDTRGVDHTSFCFACDSSLILPDLNGQELIKVVLSDSGSTRSTFASGTFGGVSNVSFDSSVVATVYKPEEQEYVFSCLSLSGEVLHQCATGPIAANVGLFGNRLVDWSRNELADGGNTSLLTLFKGGHLQPAVLKEWIEYCRPGATWGRSGLTLPTEEGSVTVMWPPVAKLLPLAEGFEYRLRCAADSVFYTQFGMLSGEVDELAELGQTLLGAHQGICDACERVQQDNQALTLATSKSQVLAALVRARSTSDEPALAQELPTTLVSSLCSSDRLAFRHHAPEACSHASSVLLLCYSAKSEVSGFWCGESVCNSALSQCGKPAVHAQRAALRLGTEISGNLLVPRFKKLCEHTHIVSPYNFIRAPIAKVIHQSTFTTISPTGEFIFCGSVLFSALSGLVAAQCTSASFSPCGKWFVGDGPFLEVRSVDDLRGGVDRPIAVVDRDGDKIRHIRALTFIDGGRLFVLDTNACLLSGEISHHGTLVLQKVAETTGRTLTAIGDRVYCADSIYDAKGVKVGLFDGIPITDTLAIDERRSDDSYYPNATVLVTLQKAERRRQGPQPSDERTCYVVDERKVTEIDIVRRQMQMLFRHRFLRPSVLADFIKIVDKRITWSDKGISLPTTDGKTFTFWWEPIAKLCAAGL